MRAQNARICLIRISLMLSRPVRVLPLIRAYQLLDRLARARVSPGCPAARRRQPETPTVRRPSAARMASPWLAARMVSPWLAPPTARRRGWMPQ